MKDIEAVIQRLKAERDEPLCAYIYDLSRLRAHAAHLMASLPPPCRLFYAIKANAEAPILRTLAPIVDGFEAASLGEVDEIRSVAPASPILLGGPAKTDRQLAGALRHRVHLINVESENELERLELIAGRLGTRVPILLRVNLAGPLPAATLHMAGLPTQFGIEQRQVPDAVDRVRRCPHLDLRGFHFHSISNNLEADAHVALVASYLRLAQAWSRELGLAVSHIDVGGGIGVNYGDVDRQFDWATFSKGLQDAVHEHCPAGWTILFECGRYLTAACGYYAAEILDLKTNHGKHYALIRGGAHHFRLPVAWQHSHPLAIVPIETWAYPFTRPELRDSTISVAGELCTPKDVLARDVPVSRVRMGDVALFPYAGAYGWSISHHDFLSHPHPEHLFLDANSAPDNNAILNDLVDALIYENLFGLGTDSPAARATEADGLPGFELSGDELYVRFPLGDDDLLLFRVRRDSWLLPYRFSRPPILRVTTGKSGRRFSSLGPTEVMESLAGRSASVEPGATWPNLTGFIADLGDAVTASGLQPSASRRLEDETTRNERPSLLTWEQIAALRDRPFHPTARAKTGWGLGEHRRFGPELGNSFGLGWVAVPKDYVRASSAARGQEIAAAVLDPPDSRHVADALARGHGSDHLALPVHPWQLDHGLPDLIDGAPGCHGIVRLARDIGSFSATSSLRTLARPQAPGLDLKLPLAVKSLGALRLLTLRKLENGHRAQQLLHRLVTIDPLLARRLHVCDETRWWIFCPPGGDPFDDRLGHLACQLRAYPRALIGDEETDLIPMAALASLTASGRAPASDYLLRRRGRGGGPDEVLSLFAAICNRFTEVALACFRYGVMPEIHGQNVLLVVRSGQIDGILLRDHDSLRVHPAWMARCDLPAPGYLLAPGTPNTLINETPEDLLAYFQTLGVQVNLYAIATALAQSHGLAEERFGQAIAHAIRSSISGLDLPAYVRDLLRTELLERASWPAKQLIAPLLQAGGRPSLGMPSAWGKTRNPLRPYSVGVFQPPTSATRRSASGGPQEPGS